MTSSEAARKHWKELKDKPFKKKLEHIVTYYGVMILILTTALVMAVGYIIHLASQKDSVLNVTCLGAAVAQEKVQALESDFVDYMDIDREQYEIDISTQLYSYTQGGEGAYDAAEVIMALAASQAVDAVISDNTTLIPYMYQRMFANLTDVLSAEQQEKYKDYFLYVDNVLVEELRDMSVITELPEFPDPTKPEQMKEPVPIAVRIPEDSEFSKNFFPELEGYVVYGVVINTVNLENNLAFLDYIMSAEK